MLALILSDSHGDVEIMERAVRETAPDVVVHLGDHAGDAEALRQLFPALDIRGVCGNCDFGSDAPESLCFSLEDVPVFAAHGHRQHVKFRLEPLANAAYFSGAKLALFGHTHEFEYRKMGNIVLFNPGSCGRGCRTAGLIEIHGDSFTCRRLDL